jgi:exopolysaccharide production protein ExoY
MLVQTPSEKGVARKSGGKGEAPCSPFEAALRRDLASAPVYTFEPVVGGWMKRAADLAIALVTAPVWAGAALALGLYAKTRHPAPVLLAERCVGYSGRSFTRWRLRTAPPSAAIVQLHASEASEAREAAPARITWRDLAERLPQMVNVVLGDMSLVGPLPLTRDQVEELKGGKKHYLSSRPGVFGIGAIGDVDAPEGAQYKYYAMGWSLTSDALIVRDVWRGLRGS